MNYYDEEEWTFADSFALWFGIVFTILFIGIAVIELTHSADYLITSTAHFITK